MITKNSPVEPISIAIILKDSYRRAGLTAMFKDDPRIVVAATLEWDDRHQLTPNSAQVILIALKQLLNDDDTDAASEALAELKQQFQHATFIILSEDFGDADASVAKLIESGASGCLRYDEDFETVVLAVKSADAGLQVFSKPTVENLLEEQEAKLSPESLAQLTPREQEVCQLLINCYSNAQIAEALCVTERTAEKHVSHILRKLNCESRVMLANRRI